MFNVDVDRNNAELSFLREGCLPLPFASYCLQLEASSPGTVSGSFAAASFAEVKRQQSPTESEPMSEEQAELVPFGLSNFRVTPPENDMDRCRFLLFFRPSL